MKNFSLFHTKKRNKPRKRFENCRVTITNSYQAPITGSINIGNQLNTIGKEPQENLHTNANENFGNTNLAFEY